MPPRLITFPATEPVPITLDALSLTAAAEQARAAVRDDAERRRIDTALAHLRGSAQLALNGGRLLLTSPHSTNRYLCTRTSCTCEAARFGRACWHRAAAMLVRAVWDAARPSWRCPYCIGPMVASRTYGGERSYTCLVCGHERHAATMDGLIPWTAPAAAAVRREAA